MKDKHTLKNKTIPLLATVSPVSIWLILLVAAPLIYVFFISFLQTDGYHIVYQFSLDNYMNLLNPTYIEIYVNSFIIAFLTTIICILIGYPFAYIMAKKKGKARTRMLIMVMVPFWTNSLIRLAGWKTILGKTGVLNTLLQQIGFIDKPLEILYTRGAVLLGMVYTLLPYMILPLFTSIEKLDFSLIEASNDLGANKVKTFFHIILPLTAAGIFSGSIMIFIPTLGFFFVSDIMGGGTSKLIGNLISTQFKSANNWPLGSALSIMLIVLTLILVNIYKKMGGKLDDLGAI